MKIWRASSRLLHCVRWRRVLSQTWVIMRATPPTGDASILPHSHKMVYELTFDVTQYMDYQPTNFSELVPFVPSVLSASFPVARIPTSNPLDSHATRINSLNIGCGLLGRDKNSG